MDSPVGSSGASVAGPRAEADGAVDDCTTGRDAVGLCDALDGLFCDGLVGGTVSTGCFGADVRGGRSHRSGWRGGCRWDPPVENLSEASDRVLRAARLFRAGKVAYVLAVGGNLPWLGGSVPEAEAMRDLLNEWGVPRDAVVTETSSRNTRENALLAAEIVRSRGWGRVLLVTSAAHMRRAVAAFRAVGLDVMPSPTDFQVRGSPPLDMLDFLPDAGALSQTSAVMREVIGLWFYRWRGWLD